jgi:hypothetical protein
MTIRKANLFIIGAPKCGTTSLYHYLDTHPEIHMSEETKEPHYFVSDFPNWNPAPWDGERYRALWSRATPHHVYLGEGSTWYLYSRRAVFNIRQYNPEARIIAMIRNPTDMVYSLHRELLNEFEEDVTDFETAWHLQEKRKSGAAIPTRCKEPSMLFYADVASFSTQLKRVFNAFPKEQIHVIIFDDFAHNTEKSYRGVLDFLGLKHVLPEAFPKVNPRSGLRFPMLTRFLKKPPGFVTRSVERIKRLFGIRSTGLGKALLDLNLAPTREAAMPEHIRTELLQYFEPEVHELEQLLSVDLEQWKPARRAQSD